MDDRVLGLEAYDAVLANGKPNLPINGVCLSDELYCISPNVLRLDLRRATIDKYVYRYRNFERHFPRLHPPILLKRQQRPHARAASAA